LKNEDVKKSHPVRAGLNAMKKIFTDGKKHLHYHRRQELAWMRLVLAQ